MNIYTTRLLEDYAGFKKGSLEVFILPSSISQESAVKVLSRGIRNRTWGQWKRLKREVISVEALTDPTNVLSVSGGLKYISTELDDGSEQLFVFSRTVDHDTMYEAILIFDHEFRSLLGAGFTDMSTCFGKSVTLDITSRNEDTPLLQSSLGV